MEIPAILENTRLWFVVGLGNNPDRAAFGVAKFLQDRGKHIIPIHPRAETVHGEQGFATISQASEVWGPPDVVDLFVNSSRAGQLSDQGGSSWSKSDLDATWCHRRDVRRTGPRCWPHCRDE